MSELTSMVVVEPNGLLRAVLRGAFGSANGWAVLDAMEQVDQPRLIALLSQTQMPALLLCGAPVDDDLVPALTEMRQRFPGLTVALLGPMPTMPVAQQLMTLLRTSEGGFVYLEHEQVASVKDIEAACRVAVSGRAALDMAVLLDLAEGIAGTARAERRPADDETLLSMLTEGLSDEAIAANLDIPMPLLLMWLDDLYERIGAANSDRDPRVYAVVHYLTQTGRAPLRYGRESAPPPPPPLMERDGYLGEEPVSEGAASVVERADAARSAPPTPPTQEQEQPPVEAAAGEAEEVSAEDGAIPLTSMGPIDWTPRESVVDDDELDNVSLPQTPRYEPEPPADVEPDIRPAQGFDERRQREREEPIIIEIPPQTTRERQHAREGQTARRASAVPGDDAEFARFTQFGTPDDVDAARRVVAWASAHHLQCRYGTGRRDGSFTVTFTQGSLTYWLLTVWAAGSMEVEFGALRAKPPFSNADARNALAERLRAVPGVQVGEADLHNRARVPLSILSTDGGWRLMEEALSWAVDSIRHQAA